MWRNREERFSKPCRFHNTGAHSPSRVQRHLEILQNYLFIIFILQSAWQLSDSSFTVFRVSEAKSEQLSVLIYAKPRMQKKSEQLAGKVSEWCKMVTPVVVMSINVFLFLTSEHSIYFQSTHLKQNQTVKTGFTLSLTFFFLSLSSHRFSHICLCCHVFTTAWDPSFWHVRASWLLNIIMLSRAWSYLSCSSL